MDFNDSPEEAAYREKARAWLEENAAAHMALRSARRWRSSSRSWMSVRTNATWAWCSSGERNAWSKTWASSARRYDEMRRSGVKVSMRPVCYEMPLLYLTDW